MKDRAGKWFSIAGLCVLLVVIAIITAVSRKETVTYRETQATRGKLAVGITEDGNVSIGTSEQTFDLDISGYTGGTEFSFAVTGGMPDMFQGMGNNTGNSASQSRALEIEEVYVTAGEEIAAGDKLLKVTDESVSAIRQELSEDAAEAEITYKKAATSRKQTDLQAQADMDMNQAYGAYAQAEYEQTIDKLQTAVDDTAEKLAEVQEELEEKEADKEELGELLGEHRTVLANAEYAKENTGKEDSLYWWIIAVNTVSEEGEIIEQLEEELLSAQEEIETLTQEIASLNTQLELARKELRLGEVTAGTQKELRMYNYENAQEIYDVAAEQGEFETEKAQADYEEAQQKLEEFDSVIVDGVISSEYSGVITQVGVSAGNTLVQDDSIIVLNDYGEATITVSVDEEDMEAAAVGSQVNIYFNAFAQELFTGEVEQIGDAQMNSNTNTTTYSVTISVDGDTLQLYEGMSAEVTFITQESEEVIYVSKRAVLQEGDSSYVIVRNEKGKIERREVITGFSDGINIEIKEGLAEGETVLIESSL